MILTPIDHRDLPELLTAFRSALAGEDLAVAVLDHITAEIPDGDLMRLSLDTNHHSQAVEFCRDFGFGLMDVDPQDYFTWDGQAVATRLEPSVIIHEIGHFQCASLERRSVLDFGLGAGPETGRKAEANAVQTVFGVEADIEEGLSSLLGIMWEAELGQPAILAFLEQNWFEGGVSLHNVGHFRKMVRLLHAHGMVSESGHPTPALRQNDDSAFFAEWWAA